MELPIDVIRGLAKLEQDMDAGTRPFACWQTERISVDADIMAELGLKTGQTVSGVIVRAICQANIRRINEKIAEQAFAEAEITISDD